MSNPASSQQPFGVEFLEELACDDGIFGGTAGSCPTYHGQGSRTCASNCTNTFNSCTYNLDVE